MFINAPIQPVSLMVTISTNDTTTVINNPGNGP